MNTSIYLFALAFVSFIAWILGKARGLAVLAGIMLIAAIVSCTQSPDAGMFIGYLLAFGWPFLVGSVAIGAVAGALFARGRYLLAPLFFLPFAFFSHNIETEKRAGLEEKVAAREFVENHPDLIRLLGTPVEASLTVSTAYSDKHLGRYEFGLKAGNPLWAIVLAVRGDAKVKLQLECVTTIYFGHRDSKKKDCDDGVVPLDGSTELIIDNVAVAGTSPQTASLTVTSPPAKRAYLPRFALGTEVQGIAIHESGANAEPSGNLPRVKVDIKYSPKPLLLVLSSHEAVLWTLNTNSREIAGILVSGNPKSQVVGSYGSSLYIGNREAYSSNEPDFSSLKDLVQRNTKLPEVAFQGVRVGAAFSVPPK